MSSIPPQISNSTLDAPLEEPAPPNHLAFLRHAARDIFATALAACSIENAFARKVSIEGSTLRFDNEVFDLESYDRVRVLAVGKAATPMLEALLRRVPLRADCDLAGIVSTPQPPAYLPTGFVHFASDHPLPNQASLDAAQAARAMLTALPSDPDAVVRTLCIFLISGGASAMLEEPLDATIPLEDMQAFHRVLIHSGASIAEINCVRKHFSAVKGGRLALAAPRGTPLLAFFVSDVPSNQLADLGSGPVLPDPTTVEQCRAVLEHYALLPQFPRSPFPASVQRFFNQRFLPETPKPGMFPLSLCTLLDSNDLVEAARICAIELGFRVEVDNTCDDWEYMAAARYLLERLQALSEPVQVDFKSARARARVSATPAKICLYALCRRSGRAGGRTLRYRRSQPAVGAVCRNADEISRRAYRRALCRFRWRGWQQPLCRRSGGYRNALASRAPWTGC